MRIKDYADSKGVTSQAICKKKLTLPKIQRKIKRSLVQRQPKG